MGRQICTLLVALLLPAATWASSGEITFLEGKATRVAAAGARAALSRGSAVEKGDTIETAAGARLEITLPDDSVLRLGPASKLVLDEAVFSETGRDFKATLLLGKVWSKVSSVFGNDRNFEVRTQRAVAGVRGTIFQVETARTKAVLVRVYEGTVAVAGMSDLAAAGQAPQARGERIQVAGPQQVSRKQWEKIVSAMMQVRVGADGTPAEPTKFSDADEAKDGWAKWNKKRDAAAR